MREARSPQYLERFVIAFIEVPAEYDGLVAFRNGAMDILYLLRACDVAYAQVRNEYMHPLLLDMDDDLSHNAGDSSDGKGVCLGMGYRIPGENGVPLDHERGNGTGREEPGMRNTRVFTEGFALRKEA